MRRMVVIFILEFAIGLDANNRTAAGNAKYVVNTPNCRILDFDPYDTSIRNLVWKWPPLNCTSLPLLTTVESNYDYEHGLKSSHTLRLQRAHLPLYHIPQDGFRCCYKLATRITSAWIRGENWPDDGYRFSDCTGFYDDVTFHGIEEFIWVKCQASSPSLTSTPYVNMHAFVANKEEVRQKMNSNKPAKDTLSVMIVGLDAMSRLNLLRTMPKTVRYLRKLGWYNMKGFNKMDDNTFPNVMATLSGMRVSPKEKSCEPRRTYMDECPIIWRDFSDAGYVTAYVEDEPFIGSFNLMKKGFYKTPTDYYTRPFFIAGYWNTQLKLLEGRVGCFGPTKVADHVFNYALDFSQAFRNHPTFSVFWQSGFSHEDLNTASALDDTVLQFFSKLAATGALNTTMVLFLSDHGMRAGRIRETFLGYLEERLPFFYFWVPEWFKKAHPDKIKNLKKNRNRLISHFDVYMTLVDFLGKNMTASGCPSCRSLFKLVPWSRTCIDAGIQDHWCTCAEYTEIHKTHPLATKIAKMVLNTINLTLQRYAGFVKDGTRCSKLKKAKVVSLKKKTSSGQNQGSQMVILIQTTPGDGRFEATVSYKGGLRVMNGISRINKYGNQSSCVQHTAARKYCYCENITST